MMLRRAPARRPGSLFRDHLQLTRSNFHASIRGVTKSPNRARTQDSGPSRVGRFSMSTMTPIAFRVTCIGLYRSSNRTFVPTRRSMASFIAREDACGGIAVKRPRMVFRRCSGAEVFSEFATSFCVYSGNCPN
jgi:hypothetical protein